MSGAIALLVVGGAVLTPSLLASASTSPVNAETGKEVDDASASLVRRGHRAAAESLKASTILGIGASTSASLRIKTRIQGVLDALLKTRGPAPGARGFPKLTTSEVFDLVRVLLDAVKLGLDQGGGTDGYVISQRIVDCGLATIALPGCEQLVSQEDAFDRLASRPFGGVPPDFAEPTDLAKRMGNAINQRFLAQTQGGIVNPSTEFDSTPGTAAALAVAEEMDAQGITFAPPDLGDVVDAVDNAVSSVPGAVADAVSGVVGSALGGILFSTPVLLAVGGYIVYRAVKS